MNDQLHISIQKAGEEVRLSLSERAKMREALSTYVAMKPVRAVQTASRERYVLSIFSLRPVALSLVVILFVSSAGISYAAEGALPGDALYGIKTHINEPLQGALALTTSAKTEWAMSVAGTRVEEATTLAAEGKLDQKTQADLQASFQAHAQIASDNIEQEASSSPDLGAEVATRFEAQLNEYQRVLTQVASAKHIEASVLANAVTDENVRVAGIRARAESNAAATSSSAAIAASRMRDAAQSAVEDSSKLVRGALSALASSSADQVGVQLDNASAAISAGSEYLKGNEAPRALATFRDALSATEKLGVFLQTSAAIHQRTGLRITEPSHSDASSSRDSSDSGTGGALATVSARAAPVATLAAKAAPAPASEMHAMMFSAKVATDAEATAASGATTSASSTATTSMQVNAEAHATQEARGTSHEAAGTQSSDEQHGTLQIALPDVGDLVH